MSSSLLAPPPPSGRVDDTGIEDNVAVPTSLVPISDTNREGESIWDMFPVSGENMSEIERLAASHVVNESPTAEINTQVTGGCLAANVGGTTMLGGSDEPCLAANITLSPNERGTGNTFTDSLTPIGNPSGGNPSNTLPSNSNKLADHFRMDAPNTSDVELATDDEQMVMEIQMRELQAEALRLRLEHKRRRANQSQTLSDAPFNL